MSKEGKFEIQTKHIKIQLRPKSVDICFITGSFQIFNPTGGEKIIFELIRFLNKMNFKVAIVVMKRKWLGDYLSREYKIPQSDIHIFRNFQTKLYYKLQNKLAFKLLFPLVRKIKHIEYDYSFANDIPILFCKSNTNIPFDIKKVVATWWGTAFFAADINLMANEKYYLIQNSEDDPSFSGDLSRFANISYELPLKKIVISNILKNRFEKDSPLKIPVGFESNFYNFDSDLSKKNPYNVLIHLGLSEYKGAKFGLDAARIIHEENQNVNLVAFGTLPSHFVPGYIKYYHRCSDQQLLSLYRDASIFIFPSIIEGSPLSPLEAMNCGCAIVSTYNRGTEEYIKNGENGILVQPGDGSLLAHETINLIENNDLRITISRNGKETAKGYDYGNMAVEFINAIELKE